uniref:Uncharacterized protein n=2 Tax=Magallana gigas TaxID=29159 RepID=A0A8W8NVG9_MAGGI
MFSSLDDEEGSWADPIKLVKEIGDGDGSFFLFRFTEIKTSEQLQGDQHIAVILCPGFIIYLNIGLIDVLISLQENRLYKVMSKKQAKMPRQLYTVLFLVLVALLLSSTPEVSAKSSCSYACMKTLFSCKRRSEGDCCNKFTECFHTCDLAAPPCAGKRGSWNKRYQVSQGYEDRELYPYY